MIMARGDGPNNEDSQLCSSDQAIFLGLIDTVGSTTV